jgi:hypothetical protein
MVVSKEQNMNDMARIERTVAYRVDLIEYECGWGSKVDDIIYFDSEAEALKYCADFNAKNTSDTVPYWYMLAEYMGCVWIIKDEYEL